MQELLRRHLADTCPGSEWTTASRVGRTPVDVAGESPAHPVVVELEWRRADSADWLSVVEATAEDLVAVL